MTPAQILRVLRLYMDKLEELTNTSHVANPKVMYLKDMILRFPQFHTGKEEREKAMRWLGFMQGTFDAFNIYTVDEMREHNAMPATKKDVAYVYAGHSLHQTLPCARCGDLDGCHHWRELSEAPDVR